MELRENGLVEAVPGSPLPGGSGVTIGPLYAAFAVAAGLSRRDRTGQGCTIDVSCADSVLAGKLTPAMEALNADKVNQDRPMADLARSAKYQHYQTAEGKYVLFCCIEPKFWDNFCRAAARDDLMGRHDRAQAVDFGFGDEDLRRELQEVFHAKSQQEWVAIAGQWDIPMGPALGLAEVAGDPHLQARGMVLHEHHPRLGDLLTLGTPVRVSGESFVVRSAPALGEHTEEILASVGYTSSDIARLRTEGIV